MSATLTPPATPSKSYLPQAERETLMREAGINAVYGTESQEAGNAGDMIRCGCGRPWPSGLRIL